MTAPAPDDPDRIDMRLVAAAVNPHAELQELRRRIAEPGLDRDGRDALLREAVAVASGLYRRIGLAPIADELDGIATIWNGDRPWSRP